MKIKDMSFSERVNIQRICIEQGIVNLASEEMTLVQLRELMCRNKLNEQ